MVLTCSIRITRFLEKPQEGLTGSRLASVVFYCVQRDTLAHLSHFLSLRPQTAGRSFGHFWVCEMSFRVIQVEMADGGLVFFPLFLLRSGW